MHYSVSSFAQVSLSLLGKSLKHANTKIACMKKDSRDIAQLGKGFKVIYFIGSLLMIW